VELLIAELGDQKYKLLLRGIGRIFSQRNVVLWILVFIIEKNVLTKKPILVDKGTERRKEECKRNI
jgi:hypothetical protein